MVCGRTNRETSGRSSRDSYRSRSRHFFCTVGDMSLIIIIIGAFLSIIGATAWPKKREIKQALKGAVGCHEKASTTSGDRLAFFDFCDARQLKSIINRNLASIVNNF